MTLVDLPKYASRRDWDVHSWDFAELRLAASDDLWYYHWLELVFTGVFFVACPAQFEDPVFREPTSTDRDTVRRYVGEDPPVLVAFDIKSYGTWVLPCIVAAESVEMVTGLVYRYWREDLKPGERIAPWVRRPEDRTG